MSGGFRPAKRRDGARLLRWRGAATLLRPEAISPTDSSSRSDRNCASATTLMGDIEGLSPAATFFMGFSARFSP